MKVNGSLEQKLEMVEEFIYGMMGVDMMVVGYKERQTKEAV